jgi:hypothetical protein
MPTYDIYLEDSKYRDLRLLPRPIQKTGGRYASFRLNRRSTAQPISHISHLVYYAYFGPDFYKIFADFIVVCQLAYSLISESGSIYRLHKQSGLYTQVLSFRLHHCQHNDH